MIDNEHVNRAIEYILSHITEEISAEEVAGYCNFSRTYFSRLFKKVTGESVYEFIKRVKMEQSAFRLKVEPDKTVTDIGAQYGYSPSNYSSTFRQHHAMSPVEFRRGIAGASMRNPIFCDADTALESFTACNAKITIEVLSDYRVIYERRIGNYGNLSVDWGLFLEKYKAHTTPSTILLERTYDDPAITDINECLYDICMSVPADCSLPNTDTIKGGKFAVYHFKSTVPDIYRAYQSIFRVWLPQSRYTIDERYGFEIYRKIECDTMYMEIDICIPVK